MAKKIKKTAAEIANELLEVRRLKNDLIKQDKTLSEALKKAIGKGEQQDVYKIRTDYALGVTDVNLALPWAIQHNCVKVDVPAADSWIKNNRHAMPEGFAIIEVEKLVEVKDDK